MDIVEGRVRNRRTLALVALGVMVCVVVASLAMNSGQLEGPILTKIGHLTIFADFDGPYRKSQFVVDDQSVTVRLAGQTARITSESVEILGVRSISIPPTCKNVEILKSRNGMLVFLDGIEARRPL
jgi:hypothetical protein